MASQAVESSSSSSSSSLSSLSSLTSSPSAPVTAARPPPVDLPRFVDNPGLPRASVACDAAHPSGSLDQRFPSLTVLQQHCRFFDADGDGTITLTDTYNGFRALGFGILLSTLAMVVVHGFMSYPTQPSWIPDWRFRIFTARLHLCKHGSDSEIFDNEGRFVPEKFEEIFSKFAKTDRDALTWDELLEFLSAIRNCMDFFGMFAARFEWLFAWSLIAENGKIGKENIRRVMDGTIFFAIEERRALEQQKQESEYPLASEAKKAIQANAE